MLSLDFSYYITHALLNTMQGVYVKLIYMAFLVPNISFKLVLYTM